MNATVKKLPGSVIEIQGELDADLFETYYAPALKKISENLKIDGFRKGKVPEDVLRSHVPDINILEEMAQIALSEHYPKIITEEKIDVLDIIGPPEISITKIARKNPLGFKIKTAVLPEIKLPDYKSLAKKVISQITDKEKETAVSDEDVENTILDIRKSRAPKIHMKDGQREGEEIKEELPTCDDEFVKGLGPFKNVVDFKTKLRENIKLEKENQVKEKTRLKIIEKIIDETKIEVPEILVESELSKILYKMESDMTAMGLKFEDYLKHLNKKREDLRKEFRTDGEKKAKLSLILNEISKVEKIAADEKQVAKEVTRILEHYKDADPERAKLHAENILTNEKIFQFLETQ